VEGYLKNVGVWGTDIESFPINHFRRGDYKYRTWNLLWYHYDLSKLKEVIIAIVPMKEDEEKSYAMLENDFDNE
jgi:hypothetical protein